MRQTHERSNGNRRLAFRLAYLNSSDPIGSRPRGSTSFSMKMTLMLVILSFLAGAILGFAIGSLK